MSNDTIIKADSVYFSYEDGHQALNGISLDIKQGRKIVFMGANGSGKSTFFLCLNGIHRPQQGTIYFHHKPIDYSRTGLLALRSKVGIVFQDPDNQLFASSVYQEISFGILNLKVPEQEAKKQVEKVVDTLEITPFRHKPTHALSGGQKKQVSIADILVMNPELIILDEPAASLDPKHTAMVNGIINRLTEQGITVILSTHDVNYAMEWADDVVLFHEGTILMKGKPEEVFSNKSALSKTNLEQPASIVLFDSLCKKGFLNPSLPLPKNLSILENYIANINTKINYGSTNSMAKTRKKAILVVSFGTSHLDTCEKTIVQIEQDIQNAFPDYTIYRAWTSKMIIKKLKKRDGIYIPTVAEACQQMIEDGIEQLIVQPTHVINGIENEQMKEDVLKIREHFSSIKFGTPLLTTSKDNEQIISALMEEIGTVPSEEAFVFMGHGTTHYANSIYAALDYQFKDMGYPNVYLGTVEAYPSMETLLKMVSEKNPKKITLAPFMIVAGDHAKNDMAGDNPDSWKYQFEQNGFQVDCLLKGLGEYKKIRYMFIDHIKEA